MIFSEQKMFADKQVIALANSAVLTTVALEHQIEIGGAQVPYGGKRRFHRNIGAGDGIPIMAFINTTNTASATEYFFTLEVARGGAWTTVFVSQEVRGAGDACHFKYLPDNIERYLRVLLNYKQDAALAGKTVTVTAAIGTYKTSGSRYI